jgi:hypothetical protein
MAEGFTVKLRWHYVVGHDDPLWAYERALYAYLAPARPLVYYFGKSYGTTVRKRHGYDAKSDVWDCINKQTMKHRAIVAEFELPKGRNLTKELVDDIECLLIYRLQPPCNVQCKSSRGKYRRPGMRVICLGRAWPLSERTFEDGG